MKKLIAAPLLLLILASCSHSIEQTATVSPASTFTASSAEIAIFEPTMTALAPTDTPPAVSSPTPEGKPVAEWNGIPIMPGAITGEGDEDAYVFTIHASSRQVQDYYRLELAALGWQSLSQGTDGSSRMLTFSNDASGTLTINILARGEEALVLLTR